MPIPLLGNDFTVSFKSKSLIAPAVGDQKLEVTMPAERALLTVISHDCEFNENKRNKLLVARLQEVQGNLTGEQRAELRASNDVEARAEAGLTVAGVDTFLFDAVPDVFDRERVANFATITPLPMKMQGELLSQKRAELNHETRVLFRRKLAWFFGRAADDIPEEDKVSAPVASTAQPAQ